MRKFAGLAAVAALALGATVVMAASPTASPATTPASKPGAAAPSNVTAPAAAAAPRATSGDWTAQVAPVQISGTMTVHKDKSGSGLVTFKLNDILNETAWSIRLERGTLEGANARTVLLTRSGDEVQRFMNDSLQIHLSAGEMRDLTAARKAAGVVAFISDGSRLSVASFPRG